MGAYCRSDLADQVRQGAPLLLQFLNIPRRKLIKIGEIKTKRGDATGRRVYVNPKQTLLQHTHQFLSTAIISCSWICFLPFFSQAIEKANEEYP